MQPIKDAATVHPDGSSTAIRIYGLDVRPAVHMVDPRGNLVEILNPLWQFHPDPLAFVYSIELSAGGRYGWYMNPEHDVQIFHSLGTVHWAFYDDRPTSSTYGMLSKLTFGEYNRSLFAIPKGVYFACVNLGAGRASMFSMPAVSRETADRNRVHLPFRNDLIPYDFTESRMR